MLEQKQIYSAELNVVGEWPHVEESVRRAVTRWRSRLKQRKSAAGCRGFLLTAVRTPTTRKDAQREGLLITSESFFNVSSRERLGMSHFLKLVCFSVLVKYLSLIQMKS